MYFRPPRSASFRRGAVSFRWTYSDNAARTAAAEAREPAKRRISATRESSKTTLVFALMGGLYHTASGVRKQER